MYGVITRKLSNLIDVIADLRSQIRVVLATELSKAVASTVREIVEVALTKNASPEWEQSTDYSTSGYQSEPEDWNEPYWSGSPQEPMVDPRDEFASEANSVPQVPSSAPEVNPSAMTLAIHTGHWLYRQSRSVLCGVAGTAIVAVASIYGGPMTRSMLTILSTVQQLVGTGDSPAPISE